MIPYKITNIFIKFYDLFIVFVIYDTLQTPWFQL